ncbi:hypothetical protein ACJMK2_027507 [Sinanodonta woodiana]|uniref:SWIM-type domain-containing protein n=1 Tax=Sinanodonta woodiana TaxID=1069815 RepID=A0ABD3XQ43_SINWO
MASKISKCSSKPMYIDSLDHQHRERYIQKLKDVSGIDPYQVKLKKFSAKEEQLPDVTFGDIIMYLVNGTSAYTFGQFKAYKSLKAYNNPEGCANAIVTAKVSHSQRLNAKPLEPWIIASPILHLRYSIVSTCMAGLGESCSHIAALLFYIEEMHKYKERVSVTGKFAYWKKPNKKSVEYKELICIDFRSATKLKLIILMMVILNVSAVPAAGISDMKQLLQILEKNNKKPAIMTLVEPFCEMFKLLHKVNTCYHLCSLFGMRTLIQCHLKSC